jgi:Cu/Ag efflux pump CusA
MHRPLALFVLGGLAFSTTATLLLLPLLLSRGELVVGSGPR